MPISQDQLNSYTEKKCIGCKKEKATKCDETLCEECWGNENIDENQLQEF